MVSACPWIPKASSNDLIRSIRSFLEIVLMIISSARKRHFRGENSSLTWEEKVWLQSVTFLGQSMNR